MKRLVRQIIELTQKDQGTRKDDWAVPPKSLNAIFSHLEGGGKVYVHTYIKNIVITKKTLEKFRSVGAWMLKEEGEGYRLQSGKGSVYLLPGQLKYGD